MKTKTTVKWLQLKWLATLPSFIAGTCEQDRLTLLFITADQRAASVLFYYLSVKSNKTFLDNNTLHQPDLFIPLDKIVWTIFLRWTDETLHIFTAWGRLLCKLPHGKRTAVWDGALKYISFEATWSWHTWKNGWTFTVAVQTPVVRASVRALDTLLFVNHKHLQDG